MISTLVKKKKESMIGSLDNYLIIKYLAQSWHTVGAQMLAFSFLIMVVVILLLLFYLKLLFSLEYILCGLVRSPYYVLITVLRV